MLYVQIINKGTGYVDATHVFPKYTLQLPFVLFKNMDLCN